MGARRSARLSSPSLENIQHFLAKAKTFAPGPDGLVYAAWFRAGEQARQTSFALTHSLCQGEVYELLNYHLAIFTPKDIGDETGLRASGREARDTRPLSLKSCDVKTETAVANSAANEERTARIHASQKGFVPERQLVDNIDDLDTAMRPAGTASGPFNPARPEKAPIGIFLDFADAFPLICNA